MKVDFGKKLNNELKNFVTKIVREVLNDPDFGLDLSDETKKQLRETKTYINKNISASEIKKKYY